MGIKRILWRCLYPACYAGNRLGVLPLRWRNVGLAAWRRDLFTPLRHYGWFGDEIESMPVAVILCGIGYRVVVSEGLVGFIETHVMAYCEPTSIVFSRDPDDKAGALWYISCSPNCGASHAGMAYDWVRAVFGGSFEYKRGAE